LPVPQFEGCKKGAGEKYPGMSILFRGLKDKKNQNWRKTVYRVSIYFSCPADESLTGKING
jgi:hypothetical protein